MSEKQPYWIAPETEDGPSAIASQLIPKYHKHLEDASICYIFKAEASKRARHVTLGMASTVAKRLQAIVDFDFIIEIAHDEWEHMDVLQRTALVDHELCHCGVYVDQEGETHWTMNEHDLEEFTAIVKRYGLWKQDLQTFVASVPKDEPPDVELPSWVMERPYE